jgi:catechol 2,3-dioxygenase-like lactoylglutathione lyase family enzyme
MKNNPGQESFPPIKMVKLVSIPVKDQDRAVEFYSKKLGFEVVSDTPFEGGTRWIELRPPGAETRVVLFTPDGHEDRSGSFVNLVFGSDDVSKSYDELRKRGVEFVQEPKTEHWGTSAILKDPDGNTFVISSLP